MQRGAGRAIRPLVSPWRRRHGGVPLVLLPEIVPAKRWQNLLHNQSREGLMFAWWNAPLLIGLHGPLRTRRHFEWEREGGNLCLADNPSGHRG